MIEIQEKVLIAPMTSFRLGGEAKYLTEVRSIDELKEAVRFAKEKNIDYYMLAGGTNVLFSDSGFNGIVIKMKMNTIATEGNTVKADAGVPLIKVVNFSVDNCLSGIESLAGVPGTFGGAIRGNAGAYGTEVGKYIKSVAMLDCDTLEVKNVAKDECDFSYRSSFFKKNKKYIVVSGELELLPNEKEQCQNKVKEIIMGRTHKGLQGVRSAGSYFMNPKVDNNPRILAEFEKEKGAPARNNTLPAGWVIEHVGLRGKKIGGAMVSEEHANYIVNTGNATSEDVIMLVSFIKQQVRDSLGIQLQEEVNYVGF